MRVESRKDLRLIARAQREGWDYDRSKVVQALMEVIDRRDPDLMMDAVDRLLKGDEIEIKRQLMELKKAGDENHVRLRLLELARLVEPAELAKLASDNGIGRTAIDGQ